MALVIRCKYCENNYEIDEKHLGKELINCPFCNNLSPFYDCSAVMLCPHCYTELHAPVNALHSDLQCPHCNNTFRTNVSFILSDNEQEESILSKHTSGIFSAGDIFDKYRIIRMIGRGGMSEVYFAQHMLLNRKVALKILNYNSVSSKEVYAKRFIREAKLANRIKSENFAAVYDAAIDNNSGLLFMAMEYINGSNIEELIRKKGNFNEFDILNIALSIAEVLIVLEEENIVHRDIKPSNIMINSDGVVKLTDFGIAKAENIDECNLTLTQGSMVFGTPNYASPEQCRSSHNVDFRSDIYSLGATMFHMASGHPPFEGKTAMEVVLKVLNEEPRDLGSLTSGFSSGFISLVHDMIKHSPEKRPQNARDLKMRIEYLLSGKKNFKISLIYNFKRFGSWLLMFPDKVEKRIKNISRRVTKENLVRLTKTVAIIFAIFLVVLLTMRYIHSLTYFYNRSKIALVEFVDPAPMTEEKSQEQTPEELENAAKQKNEYSENTKKFKHENIENDPVHDNADNVSANNQTNQAARKKSDHANTAVRKKRKTEYSFYDDALRNAILGRLEKCNAEMARLKSESSSNDDHSWYTERLKFYRKLKRNLFAQLSKREMAFNVKYGKDFKADIAESIAIMVHEYSKYEHKEPFNAEDKLFAQQMLHYIRAPKSNPNVFIKDHRHPEFSGPLLRWVEHAEMPMKKEILKELMLHYVSADCIKGKCSIELCKYGIMSMNGLLTFNLRSKKFDNVITLIEHGADVNEFDDNGRTPLHWAVLYNNMEIVRYLLIAGADVNAADKKELQTPLFYAEKYASWEIRDLLIKLGADSGIRDKYGKYSQNYSFVREFNEEVKKGNAKSMLMYLKEYPQLSNTEMTGGLTPLQFCCMQKNIPAVAGLLKYKANPNAVSYTVPYTPLQIVYEYPKYRKMSTAVRSAHWKIFAMLLKHGANAGVPPIGYKYPSLLQFSLSDIKNIDELHMDYIDSIIRSYDTAPELPVILSMMYDNKDLQYKKLDDGGKRKRILAMLLRRQPDLSAAAFEEIFPLVAWSPQISESELNSLLKCKARINGRDKFGRNALYIICEYIARNQQYLDNAAIKLMAQRIKYLRKHGADKTYRYDMTPIEDMGLPDSVMAVLK